MAILLSLQSANRTVQSLFLRSPSVCRARPARHADGTQGNLCRYGGEYDRREKTNHRDS